MEVKPTVTFRISKEARDQLKVVAAMEKRPMGEILEEMIGWKYKLHMDKKAKTEK